MSKFSPLKRAIMSALRGVQKNPHEVADQLHKSKKAVQAALEEMCDAEHATFIRTEKAIHRDSVVLTNVYTVTKSNEENFDEDKAEAEDERDKKQSAAANKANFVEKDPLFLAMRKRSR